jgi:hypothetical protein
MVRKLDKVPDTGTLVSDGEAFVVSKRRRTAKEGFCGQPGRVVQFVGDLCSIITVLCEEHVSAANPGGRYAVRYPDPNQLQLGE